MSTAHYTSAALATTLAQYDLPLLRVAEAAAPLPLTPAELMAALLTHEEPRLQEILIAFWLRYPQWADQVPDLLSTLSSTEQYQLQHLYTAAVYLQRLWWTQLAIYLGPAMHPLPNYFGETVFALPATDVHYGEAGLRLLAARLEEETGYNWLSTYQSSLDLLVQWLCVVEDSHAA